MMKANDLVHSLSDIFPYRRKSTLDWALPVSVGLSVGVAVGLGIGVLIAPTSGERIRQRLLDGAERVKERAKDIAQRAQESLQEESETSTSERTFANDLGGIR